MNIQTLTDRSVWNEWIKEHSLHTPHTQSFEWGVILEREHRHVERIAIFEGQHIIALAQLYYIKLPFGWCYAFIPKGPLTSSLSPDTHQKLYETLADYLKTKKCIFFRAEPYHIPQNLLQPIKKSIDLHMPATLLLDLRKPSDQLLSEMHPKTRYNIRLAQKKGLVLTEDKNAKIFWRLSQETSARDRFRLHPQEHYDTMLASPFIHQLSLQHDQTTVVSGIFVGFGDTYSYLHGASAYAHRSLMAPYLLQWSAIQKARQLGFTWYDFYGLAPEEKTEQRTTAELLSSDNYIFDPEGEDAGFTRFKLGFGGVVEVTPGTWDILIDYKKYTRYQLFRKIRRYLKFIP